MFQMLSKRGTNKIDPGGGGGDNENANLNDILGSDPHAGENGHVHFTDLLLAESNYNNIEYS